MCLFRKTRKTQTEESEISSKLKGIEGDIKAMRQKLDSLAEESDTSSKLENIDGQLETINKQLNNMAEDPKDKIYLQLHEQYAINNNANLGTIMALVIALIAVIGYFGHVYFNTSNDFIVELSELHGNIDELMIKGSTLNVDTFNRITIENQSETSQHYDYIALFFVYIASLLVLAILFCFCTYQGVAQRKEQFIIHAIRKEFDKKKSETPNLIENVLPERYNPYRKKGFEIIQGLYGELVKVFCWAGVALALAMIFRLLCFYDHTKSTLIPLDGYTIFLYSAVVLGILLIIWLCCRLYYIKQYKSYILRQIEYSEDKKLQTDYLEHTEIDVIRKEKKGYTRVWDSIIRVWYKVFKNKNKSDVISIKEYEEIIREWKNKSKHQASQNQDNNA